MGSLGSNGLLTHTEVSKFLLPLRKMQVVQATNPGDLRVHHGEVMGEPMAWWEEEQRYLTGPRRNLVLCSAVEIKEEGDGESGQQGR